MPIDLDDLNTNKLINLKDNVELEAENNQHGPFPIQKHNETHAQEP